MSEPKWGVPEAQWTDDDHLAYREYVVREHLDMRMPVIELHRNHGIPLSRVREWIALFTAGGASELTKALRSERRPLRSYR